MEYKVSVIIPLYNRADLITGAVDSVLRQTLDGVEILLVDDGSQDDSYAVAQALERKYPNLRAFHQDNAGPGIARNLGLDHAQGEYVIFLDSDDWIPEGAYEALYQKAKETDADVVVGQLLRKIDGSEWFNPPKIKAVFDTLSGKNCAKDYHLPLANPASVTRLCRRAFLDQHHIRFTSARLGEDMLFNLSLFEKAERIYTIDDIVYMYETDYGRKDSQISSFDAATVNSGIEVVKSYALFFDKQGLIDYEDYNLSGLFDFILYRFWSVPDGEEKNAVFENIKSYLANYKGRVEYAHTIEHVMGMDLDTLLSLPYPTYQRQKAYLQALKAAPSPKSLPPQGGELLDQTLALYKSGLAGFRYICKYFAAWLGYKFGRRPN